MKQQDGFSGQRAIVLPKSIIEGIKSNPLFSSLYISDIGYYPKAQYHYIERHTPISQYVFIYCVDGKGWYEVKQKRYTVEKNQFFILPVNVAHTYAADESEPWTIYWIHFCGILAKHFSEECVEPKEIKPAIHSRISDRIELFEEIFRTLEQGYGKENLLYACAVFHHFLGTVRFIQQYRQANNTKMDERDVIDATIHFMKENIEKKITLSQMAEHVGYSVSHFSTLFNQRTTYSPTVYFNQLKIQKACQLLDLSDMKINQICYKIGIDDSYYFSRLFHKVVGMSPSDYKKMKKG